MTQAFENYNQLRVLKRPLTGVYLSFFLMVTLMILVGATWMGLYLAKRITRPVQMLAAAAREIGAGHLDQRVEPQSNDEFGSLVEAFNAMAGELATSRRKVERVDDRARAQARRGRRPPPLHRDDSRAHRDRRRLGRRRAARSPRSTARPRGCSSLEPADRRPAGARGVRSRRSAAARRAARRRRRAARPSRRPRRSRSRAKARSCTSPPWRRRWSATAARSEGVVLVLDDVTPLIRAQKVAAWREVARRLAHEIKNPLTPIQLSAERLRRHFAGAPPQAQGARRRVHARRSSARSSR